MTKYQLAKLLLMAGGLKSRKRVQKTVHLLKAAGCPLNVDFRLHYYGPYSAELADLLDRMTDAGELLEESQPTSVGTQYDYRFNQQWEESLGSFEQTGEGREAREEIERYGDLLGNLCRTSPRILELASTAVAFHEAGRPWEDAAKETADFKRESIESPMMARAIELARKVFPSDNG